MKKNSRILLIFLTFCTIGHWSCHPSFTGPEASEEEARMLPDEWMFAQRAYPYQHLNADVYREAFEQTRKARQQAWNRGPSTWEIAGPVNIGGRITDLALDPSDQNVIYAGTSEGGLFKSSDGGETWQAVFENIGSNSIGDVALASSQPEILYVGTGEANGSFISGAFFGDGVYRSSDGGQTWAYKGLGNSNHIGRIAVDPDDPDRLFVAATGRLYGKNEERGLFRSEDGGDSWQKVLYLSDSTACIDVVLNPENPNIVYAAMWERIRMPWNRRYAGVTSGVYRSFDGGDTWEKMTNGLPPSNSETGRIGLYISPSAPNVVFSVFTRNPITNQFNGIYRSDDAGTTWYRIDQDNIDNVFSTFGWFFGNIRVSPVNSNDIWCLGVSLLRTLDNGSNWQTMQGNMHVDFHALEIHPEDPDFVVAGNDGGIYISKDNGQNWSHVETIPNNMFYNCAIDNLLPERIYGGTQDNGTLRTLTGQTNDWERILGGDGFHVIVDPVDNQFVYAEYQFGNLFRSTSGGNSMTFIFSGQPDDRTNWNTPITLDPQDPTILYYGANRLYKSTDRGDNWLAISSDLTNGEHPSGNQSYGTITTISVSPVDPNTIYVGTDDGNVQVTFNGGQDWANISGGLPERYVTKVAAHPTDPLTAYVTLSGFRNADYQPHVLLTEDGGLTWQDISSNLPEIPVNDIIVHPDHPELLFIANDMGVWYSWLNGAIWEIAGNDLPLSVVNDIDLHPATNTLLAATFGRSILRFDITDILNEDPTPVLETARDERSFSVRPNPLTTHATLSFDLTVATEAIISLHALNGELIQVLAKRTFSPGSHNIEWTRPPLATGSYFFRLQTPGGISVRKVLIAD